MLIERRDFLKSVAAVSTVSLATGKAPTAAEAIKASGSSNAAVLPRRGYGKTDVQLSVIGLGGILVSGVEQKHANRLVAEAVERGVNYFDFAPTYGDAEEKLGPALEPYRKDAFLACKTTECRREGAKTELERSLKRLRTDHFDLYQLHAISSVEKDVDIAFAKAGAMEVFLEAKKSGKVRFLGFSAHSVEAALAAMDRYDFDSVLFPFNFAAWFEENFGAQVMETAKSKGVARLALKAMARQHWPKNDPQREKYRKCWYQPLTDRREAEIGLRFTLSQPITAAIPPGEESLFRLALNLAMDFKPITSKEVNELKTLAAKLSPIFPKT